jgi:hypothetical protein
VSWRRAAVELGAGGKIDGSDSRGTGHIAPPAAADTRAAPVGISVAPQSPQNLLPDGFSDPQAAQRTDSGRPQSWQTFFPSGLALPQLGHSMPHLICS